jgi:ABC-type bacteriocin/lantibiotic exporter with double-glycine peptidase domain
VNCPVRARRAILAVLLFGCIAAARAQEVRLDVPFVKQAAEGCGAASIAMVMQYWSVLEARTPGERANPAYILRSLHSRAGHGIYASAMSRYFEEQGFQAYVFTGDWTMLEQHLQKGRPLIVALKPSAMERSLHFVVVAGMDSQNQIILVNDPAERKLRKLDRVAFEKQWGGVQRWTLLALPGQSGR